MRAGMPPRHLPLRPGPHISADIERADGELRDIARGNVERYQLLRESLRRLAAGAGGPDLAEMAREVLSGRATLRHAMMSRAYAEAWAPHIQRLIAAVDEQRRNS